MSIVINDTLPLDQFTATASQTVFNVTWTVDQTTDVVVYARASGISADDTTDLVTSGYTVSLIGGTEVVRVTFSSGRTVGDIITITRDTPATRDNLYINTNFTPSMLNGDIKRLTLIDQQNEMFNAAVGPRYNVSATTNDTADLILPVLGGGQTWVKNAGNTAFIPADITIFSGGAGGDATQIQYNNGGILGGDSGFTTDGAGSLTVTGNLSVDNLNVNGNSIISDDTNGNILVTPNGTGKVGIGTASPGAKLDVDGTLFADSISFNTGTATIDGFIDDDSMATASATNIASAESVKAYVDSSASSGLVLISSATASGSASVQFSGLSSAYSAYVIVILDVLPVTDDSLFNLRTSTDNGASFDSGASDYGSSRINILAPSSESSANNATAFSIASGLGNNTNEKYSGTVTVFNPADSQYTKIISDGIQLDFTPNTRRTVSGGFRKSTTAVNAIQFIMSSGNIATGTFKLYGMII